MKNLEYKVRADDPKQTEKLLRQVGARFVGTLHQRDQYFSVQRGRLKTRTINGKVHEVIFYDRANRAGSKISNYQVINLRAGTAKEIEKLFGLLFKKAKIVTKQRRLWLYRHTRIHVDKVRSLGSFVELETVMKGISLSAARSEQKKVISLLHLGRSQKIARSYGEL